MKCYIITYLRFLLIISVCAWGYSCHYDNENIEPKPDGCTIKINSYYILPKYNNIEVPDSGSDIFLYYGYNTIDLIDFSIDEKGILSKNDKRIIPFAHLKMPETGTINHHLYETEELLTIILRSNLIKGRVNLMSFSTSRDQIKWTNRMIVEDPAHYILLGYK